MTPSQDRAARLAELHRHLTGQLEDWQAAGAPGLRLSLTARGATIDVDTTGTRQRGGKPTTAYRQNERGRAPVTR